MWYVKMYFSEKRELFQCDASGIQGVPSVDREFPFLESLLTFLEMDCGELTPILQRIADRWGRLITEFDRDAGTEAMVELGQLKSRHIYLELLYVRWYDRFSRMGIYGDWGSAEDEQMLAELRDLPEQLLLYQKQVQRFFDLVLDVDSAGATHSSRQLRIIFTIVRGIPACFASAPFHSALSQWNRGGVRRFCTPPAFRT